MANKWKELWDNFPLRFIAPYVRYEALALKGQIKKGAIVTADEKEQRYVIYLPQGNDDGRRYASLYHLHGAGLRESLLPEKPIAKKIFGSSLYFDQWSPYALSEAHPNPDLSIDIITGWVVDYGQRYRDHLSSIGVTLQ